MATEREPPTLIDYVVAVVSPMLIMLMVGSLVFFLVEVLYAGKYSDRLLYTVFFFVIGAVLVARIAIQYDPVRAGMYGLGLGFVTFLAMTAYVEYPAGTPLRSITWLVNLGLLGVVWWTAHKLTWDCTYVDEEHGASGRGMLSAAGLASEPRESEPAASIPQEPRPKKKRKKHESRLWEWIERFRKHRDKERKKGHTPGVWVVYFALAALPLFAIGQSLIDPGDAVRRRRTFQMMAVYVGSGLALLVVTSLLGLRYYLRQRKAKPPMLLTAGWLGLGAVLIVVFLTLGAFLPRPHSEVPWFGLQRAGKADRKASKYAQLRDSAGTGEGASGQVSEKGDGRASGKNGQPGGSSGRDGKGAGQSKDGKTSTSGNRDSKGGGKGKDQDEQKTGAGGETDRETGEAQDSDGRDGNEGSTSPEISPALEKVARFAKWLVTLLVIVLVFVFVVLAVLRYLAPFTDWAQNLLDALRNWWAKLFRRGGQPRAQGDDTRPRGPLRPPPFATFSHPFEDGTAPGRDPSELIEYTFAGLDAWAWDRCLGREPTETALEFAERLGREFVDMAEPLRRFANLYARATYSTGELPRDALRVLEDVWDLLVHGAIAAMLN